jgi:hypothetical protein
LVSLVEEKKELVQGEINYASKTTESSQKAKKTLREQD